MVKIEVVLVSGRTMDQGTSLEIGKVSDEYFRSVAMVELSPEDMRALEVSDGDPVEISTAHGSVVVSGRASDELDPGMAFMPYGPWANQIIGAYTGGTGMPLFKNVKATLTQAKGRETPSLRELVEKLRS